MRPPSCASHRNLTGQPNWHQTRQAAKNFSARTKPIEHKPASTRAFVSVLSRSVQGPPSSRGLRGGGGYATGSPATDWMDTMSAEKAPGGCPHQYCCPLALRSHVGEGQRPAIFDAENDQVILPLDAYNTDGKDEYFTKALSSPEKCFCRTRAALQDLVRTEGSAEPARDLRNLER